MTSISFCEARTHFSELLDRVARGKQILITRRGRPAALLTPPPDEARKDVKKVVAEIKALRRGNTLGKGVPTLWPLEVANALLMGERRGRATEAKITKFLGLLKALPIGLDDETALLRAPNKTRTQLAAPTLRPRRGPIHQPRAKPSLFYTSSRGAD